jgi:outer membrane lipoprotein-sorting protein
MTCLVPEQLARIALGFGCESTDDLAHLERCPRCQAELESMRLLASQIAQANRRFDQHHEEGRERLLASLPVVNTEVVPKRRSQDFLTGIGALTMRHRLAFGGAAAGIVLVASVFWFAPATNPALAMGQSAHAIRQARSYSCTMTTEMSSVPEPGKPAIKTDIKGRFFWLAPGSYRIETKAEPLNPPGDVVLILPAGQAGIEIDHKARNYVRQPARLGQISPLMMVEKLSAYSGQADKLLGTKVIDGETAKGFAIEARKIDPDVYAGPTEIWISADSHLPLLIRYQMQTSGVPTTIQMANFRWNADLDPRLFDPAPPAGYAETVRQPSPLDDQVRKITESLKTYARYSGGHYPWVKMLYGDVTRDELVRQSGAPYPPRNPADASDPRLKAVYDATWGFATINSILRDNADAAYHGKSVGPGDKDKVLLRWKLDDGTYSIIYGDLRSETVTAGRLRVLEER